MKPREPLPIFVDVHGTMTDRPKKVSNPRHEVIELVKRLCQRQKVIVWSGCGWELAQEFCDAHGIKPFLTLGKPQICVDDQPHLLESMKIITPDEFLSSFRE